MDIFILNAASELFFVLEEVSEQLSSVFKKFQSFLNKENIFGLVGVPLPLEG